MKIRIKQSENANPDCFGDELLALWMGGRFSRELRFNPVYHRRNGHNGEKFRSNPALFPMRHKIRGSAPRVFFS